MRAAPPSMRNGPRPSVRLASMPFRFGLTRHERRSHRGLVDRSNVTVRIEIRPKNNLGCPGMARFAKSLAQLHNKSNAIRIISTILWILNNRCNVFRPEVSRGRQASIRCFRTAAIPNHSAIFGPTRRLSINCLDSNRTASASITARMTGSTSSNVSGSTIAM